MKRLVRHRRVHAPIVASILVPYYISLLLSRLQLRLLSPILHLFFRLPLRKAFTMAITNLNRIKNKAANVKPPPAATRLGLAIHSVQKGLASFAAESKAEAHGTLAMARFMREMQPSAPTNASVESVDSRLSCNAILEGLPGSPDYVSRMCAARFLGVRGEQDLQAALNASLESLCPFGSPSEVSLSQIYAQATAERVTVDTVWWRIWFASFITAIDRISGKTARLEKELQEQRQREFDAKFTSFDQVFAAVEDFKARVRAEAEARVDSDSMQSLDATFASVVTSAATMASSLVEINTGASSSTVTPPTTPQGTPELNVEGVIETVAHTSLGVVANMTALVANTASDPRVVINDTDWDREMLRLKGRGARATGVRAQEWSPSTHMCDPNFLAAPITSNSRTECTGCGYYGADCRCFSLYGPHGPRNTSILHPRQQYGHRVYRPQPRFSSSSPPIPASFRRTTTVTSNLNLLGEAGPSSPRGDRREMVSDDEPLSREAAYRVIVDRQRNVTRPHARNVVAGMDSVNYLCPNLGADDSKDEDEESEDDGSFFAFMQNRRFYLQ